MAFFTWRGFARLLKKLLPIFVDTVTTAPASRVPGALVKGLAPDTQVMVATGSAISKGMLSGYVIMVLGALRMFGDLTGKWHIPLGADDQANHLLDLGAELVQSALLFLAGLGIHGIRAALPPKQLRE